jgi:hypothetical protein
MLLERMATDPQLVALRRLGAMRLKSRNFLSLRSSARSTAQVRTAYIHCTQKTPRYPPPRDTSVLFRAVIFRVNLTWERR